MDNSHQMTVKSSTFVPGIEFLQQELSDTRLPILLSFGSLRDQSKGSRGRLDGIQRRPPFMWEWS